MRPIQMEDSDQDAEGATPMLDAAAPVKRNALQWYVVAVALMLSVAGIAGIAYSMASSSYRTAPKAEASLSDVVLLAGEGKPLSLGLGTACRKKAGDHTIVPKHAKIKKTSRQECLADCQKMASCHAAEYRESEQRCELWEEPARGHETLFYHKTVSGRPDFECYIKSGRCDTIKAHKKQLEGSMESMLNYIKDHCMEGPSTSTFDKCSKANARFCKATQESCVEGSSLQCD